MNVIYHTTAVSVLEKEGRLREIKRNVKANERPGWQIRLESRIGALRRKISHTYVLIECNRTKAYSKHQKEIKRKFEKQYGKATINNLNTTITKLKQNLAVESEKLKRRKSIRERKYVNRIFKVSPKKIYREMRDGSNIKVSQMPEQSKVEDFWSSVWSIPLQHNAEAHWMNEIREEYCKDVNPKPYVITDEILNKILSKMVNDKPGRDLIPGLWINRLTSTRDQFKQLLISIYNLEQDYPQWLVLSKTLLIAKNEHTEQAQNYRPIAIQNSMYKVFTAIISEFIMYHCTTNNIVTEEQAAGKIGSWGCTDQLLINKIVYEEVTKNRRNLTTAWLDYRKAFDSVPHSWIIESLQLAKKCLIRLLMSSKC